MCNQRSQVSTTHISIISGICHRNFLLQLETQEDENFQKMANSLWILFFFDFFKFS